MRKQLCRLSASTALMVTLSACAAFQGRPERPTALDSSGSVVDKIAGSRQLQFALAGGSDTKVLSDGTEVLVGLPKPGEGYDRLQRNNLIDARLFAVDRAYRDYELRIFNEGRNSNFLFALADLGADLAGSLTGGSEALSALSAGITGASGAFNSEILVEKTITALINQMQANRAVVRERIYKRMNASIADYTLVAAVSDLEDYFHAGTLASAIVKVTQTTSDEARKAEDDAEESKSIQYKLDASSLKIRNVIYTDSSERSLDTAGILLLDSCLTSNGYPKSNAPGFILADFIFDPKFALDRNKIADCLK